MKDVPQQSMKIFYDMSPESKKEPNLCFENCYTETQLFLISDEQSVHAAGLSTECVHQQHLCRQRVKQQISNPITNLDDGMILTFDKQNH